MMNQKLALSALMLTSFAVAEAADQPNVVYILADDLGWSDISSHPGGTIKTPVIDRLFADGVELRQFMGCPVCSPTRAMLLTGRHSFRVGSGPATGGELPLEETTIAEVFKANGYRTGVFGKWHNGEDPDTPEFRRVFGDVWEKSAPTKKLTGGFGVNAHGFDEAWVYYGGGEDYFTRRTLQGRGPVSWWHNRDYHPDDKGYTDDLVTEHALEFIRASADKPFFCYIPFHIVHKPHQAKDSDLAGVNASVTDQTKRVYEAMVHSMDHNVALVLEELERLKLRENTIVVFTSDNGATKDGSNLPFRGGKHTAFEGGTHLPTVVHWPRGRVVGRSWDGLCGAYDMMPTLAAMAGCSMPPTRPLDGKNIWPALQANSASPVESFYWVWEERDAIRTDRWRMHRLTNKVELYDIKADISETKDVSAANPVVVKDLEARMDAWASSLHVQLTHRPNPVEIEPAAAPEGEVLEMTVTVDGPARSGKAKNAFLVQFANMENRVLATDSLEFDIACAPGALLQGFAYTPFKRKGEEVDMMFRRGIGVDQFGREQFRGPAIQKGPGIWEHRRVGLGSFGPGALPLHGINFEGGAPGTYRIYLDNVGVRHEDGSTTVIWAGGKDSKSRRNEVIPTGFRDLSVRAVPLVSIFHP